MPSHVELSSYISNLSPIVYWKLDETSGTSFTQSGSSTAGSMVATGVFTAADTELIPGDTTKFIKFGNSGYATATRGDVTVPFGDVTISYLIKFFPPFASANIFAITLMGSGDTSLTTNAQTYQYFTPSNATFNEIMEYGTGVNELVTSQNSLDLRFYLVGSDNTFLVTTVRNSVSKILTTYINGKIFDQQSYSNNATGGTSAGVVFSLSSNTTVGIAAGANPLALGHVCIFNRTFTDAEVAGLAQAAGRYDGPNSSVRFQNVPESALSSASVSKTLLCAVDPLVDISVAFPDDAYTTED